MNLFKRLNKIKGDFHKKTVDNDHERTYNELKVSDCTDYFSFIVYNVVSKYFKMTLTFLKNSTV